MDRADETSQPEYRLHVPALIVLCLVLLGLVVFNLKLRVIREIVLVRGAESHALRDSGLGWPLCWQPRGSMEVDLANGRDVAGYSNEFDEVPIQWAPLAADIGIGLALAAAATLITECICRRRSRSTITPDATSLVGPPQPSGPIPFTRRRVLAVVASVLLIALGAWWVYLGLHELMRLSSGEKNIIFAELDVHLNHTESLVNLTPYVRSYASSNFVLGTALVLGGILTLAKRFTLKSLLLASLLAALTGSVPFAIHSPTTAYLRIHLNVPPSSAAIDQLRMQLQPDAALPKIPAALLKSLDLKPAAPIRAFKLETPTAFDGSSYSSVTLSFDPALTTAQIETLVEFYWHCLRTVTLENTTEKVPDSLRCYDQLGNSLWSKEYQAAWDTDWQHAKNETK